MLISVRARRIRTDISTAALKNLRRTDISTIRADISTDAPIQVAFFSERWCASAVGRLSAEALAFLRCAILAVWSSLFGFEPLAFASQGNALILSTILLDIYKECLSVQWTVERADISTC